MELTPSISFAKKETGLSAKYKYSICTLVTDLKEYAEMVASFIAAGFSESFCEYRYIDNSSANTFDAYQGYNVFLQNAQGEYIILCHQDLLLQFDKREHLDKRIKEMDALDPDWAILSNAGGIENNLFQRAAMNVAYPDGFYQRVGVLPQKVVSVDENFIVVKRSANLALSGNLSGFHLYGTDLCLVAELLGYTAYVIEFKLLHKSYGTPNQSYYNILQQLINKYMYFMRSRHIVTTITDFYLSPSGFRKSFYETKLVRKVARKITKLQRSKAGIKVYSDSKIYIFCPAGYATGGPEYMHQLAFYLIKCGYNAIMYYYQTPESSASPVHANYEHYRVPYSTEIENKKNNLIIMPETHLGPLSNPAYKLTGKVILWLSVDNYLVVLNDLIAQKQHKKFFGLKKALGRYSFPDLDFIRKSGAYNIVQSHYAEDFLRNNNIELQGYINDYLSNTFIKQSTVAVGPRKDYVLYNPKKGLAFTKRLMEAAPDLQWKPLINLTPQQVAGLLKESKVYIDFGEHPGRDRFPREAAIMGCCIITGMRGSAANQQDMPIPDEFKFDEMQVPLQSIIDKIKACLSQFEIESLKFDVYRQEILGDEEKLETSIKAIFVR